MEPNISSLSINIRVMFCAVNIIQSIYNQYINKEIKK